MSDDLIYFKTSSGEDAVRERTRLVQRNLRMVLILVDGFADVAALKQKAGDAAKVEAALTELERMGLIEPMEVHIARTAAATNKVPPVLTEEVPVEEAKPEPSLRTSLPEETVFAMEVTNPAGGGDRLVEPEQRRKRVTRVKPGRFVAVLVMGAAIFVALGLMIYPYDEYRPAFEQRLSQALADEVRIGNVRVGFMPMPVITLERVSVGAGPYAEADLVRLVPELGSILGDHRYAEVQIEGLRLKNSGFGRLHRWFAPEGMKQSAIQRLLVEGLSLDFERGSLSGLAGTAEIDPQRGLGRFVLRSKDDQFRAEAVPTAKGLSLSASATNWNVPVKAPLVLTAMELQGELSTDRLQIERIEGRAFDGLFAGNGLLAWDRDASLMLRLDLQHVAAGKLLAALGGASLADGEADVRMVIAAEAPTLGLLEETRSVEGGFRLARGSIKKIDLVDAMRLAPGGVVRGGGTGFEELTGTFSTDAQNVRFSGLRLSSGLMQSTGQATINRANNTIAGAANVEMRSSAGIIRAAISISGDAADPELRSGR